LEKTRPRHVYLGNLWRYKHMTDISVMTPPPSP
jgi:hypothetical protein